ncbi:GNAT family N-acetyltransferase [Labedella phragmitis]|uniref:GNAT family N-acetyltransferase n=1 Tax=Labedella phragmitis TaxID=2498849 RepID=UPI001FB732B6|nr:N-acetyltransferase [Labedella phragmitis]
MDQHVIVRAAQDADFESIDRVVLEAFGDDGEKVLGLVDALRPSYARAELVAEVGDEVVGHVMLSHSWLDARAALVDVLVLSPLAVAPRFQRRGIGGALLGGAFASAEELAMPAIFLEGDPAYYSRQGFAAAEPLGFERPSLRIPEQAFHVALIDGHEDWMSGRLVYAEPFWTNDCVGLRDPLLTQLGG